MTPRRLAALEALAVRGATEGERTAARNALAAYHAEQAQQREQAQRRTQERPRNQQRSPFSNTDEYARFLNDLFRREAQQRVQEHDVIFRNPPYYETRRRYQPQPPKPPTPEPRVTQTRRATAADFPELLTASADPSNPDVLVVEFATAAQMWDRFNSEQPWRVLWQGFVWEAPKPCGTLHDRAKLRFYVKIDRRQLREVTVPA